LSRASPAFPIFSHRLPEGYAPKALFFRGFCGFSLASDEKVAFLPPSFLLQAKGAGPLWSFWNWDDLALALVLVAFFSLLFRVAR